MGRYCASQNKTLEEKYLVSENEYAAHGGSFPLIIENVGVVGCITVSGLAQEVKETETFALVSRLVFTLPILFQQDDHNLVVNSIKEYLQK